jgi:glycine/D-amino acid oxidase-like deaminating enzyme
VATGWHGHGFMRAPAVGERLAKQVLGGEGITHWDPTRFDGDEPVDLPAGIVD